MKSTPEPSTQEVLAGLVERVTFHNAENGFCVLRAKARFGMISNPRRRGGSYGGRGERRLPVGPTWPG
jgi:hypothetical protein